LTIPLSEISFLMRGLGFYPTEQEVSKEINKKSSFFVKIITFSIRLKR
jgi:hypothetical protein